MSEKKYILEVDELGINFGGLRAVNNFSMKIEEGQLYGLIGPNGAGKTTVFNMLTGVYTPTDGTVKLEGKKINGMKPYAITRLGIARTFQNIRLFKDMTVKENVLAALDTQASYGLFSGMFKLPNSLKQEKDMDQEAMSLLEVFHLERMRINLRRIYRMVNSVSQKSFVPQVHIQNYCCWMSLQQV